MKKLATIILALFLSACIGAGPVTTTVASGSSCPSKEVGHLVACPPKDIEGVTRGDVLTMWGKPKSSGKDGAQEYLIYNKDIAWRGLLVFVLVPIPLMLPVGHNQTTLFFENDHLVRSTSEYGQAHIALCGMHSEGPDGFGCTSDWH